MTIVAVLADGAADPEKGPGGTYGLLAGFFLCYLYWRWDKWRQQRKGGGGIEGVPPPQQVPKPRHAQAELPAPEPVDDDSGPMLWYGRIKRDANGIGKRVRHIATTGESLPPAAVEAYEPPTTAAADVPAPEVAVPADPDSAEAEQVVHLARESAQAYAARLAARGFDRAVIVASLQEHYEVSRATAYRVAGRRVSRPVRSPDVGDR